MITNDISPFFLKPQIQDGRHSVLSMLSDFLKNENMW